MCIRDRPRDLPSGLAEERLPARFGRGEVEFSDVDSAALTALIARIHARCGEAQLAVVGHTCALGPESVNLRIGRRRARAAQRLLVQHGVERERTRVESAGSARAEASNATSAGREANRRVTVYCNPENQKKEAP